MTETPPKPSQYLGPGPAAGRTFEAVNGLAVATPRVTKLSYAYAADALAIKAGVPDTLVSALVNAESSWNPNAVSSAGATGLGQFMLATATDYGLAGSGFDNRKDAALNLTATVLYLADLKIRDSTWRAAIGEYSGQGPSLSGYAGYSAGQVLVTTVDALDGVTQPPPPPPPSQPSGDTYVGVLQDSSGKSITISATIGPAAAAVGGTMAAGAIAGIVMLVMNPAPAQDARAPIPSIMAQAESSSSAWPSDRYPVTLRFEDGQVRWARISQ